jgi:hypothetical protein
MRHVHRFVFFLALLSSGLAVGQITEDPEERREQGQAPLRATTPEGNPLPFKQRLRFGGGISALQIGNPFNIGLSPVLAYQASERLVVGLGAGYTYGRSATGYYTLYGVVPPYRSHQFSGRLFAMFEIVPSLIPNLYAHGEIDQRNSSTRYEVNGGIDQTISGTGTLLGATYAQPIGRLFSVNLSVLYNFNYSGSYNNSVLYGTSPWEFRIQFF